MALDRLIHDGGLNQGRLLSQPQVSVILILSFGDHLDVRFISKEISSRAGIMYIESKWDGCEDVMSKLCWGRTNRE